MWGEAVNFEPYQLAAGYACIAVGAAALGWLLRGRKCDKDADLKARASYVTGLTAGAEAVRAQLAPRPFVERTPVPFLPRTAQFPLDVRHTFEVATDPGDEPTRREAR